MSSPSFPRLFAGKRRAILPWLCTVGLAQALLSLGLTLTLAQAADQMLAERAAAPGAGTASLAVALAGLAVLAVLTLGLRTVESAVSERLGQSYVHRLRLAMWDHLCALPARSVNGTRRGALILRFVGDLGAIKNWVSRGIVGGVAGAATLTGALGALVYLDWRIAGAASASLALTAAAQLLVSSTLSTRVRSARRLRGRLATDIVERIDALDLVQSSGQGRRERRRLRRRSRELLGAVVDSARTSGFLSGIADAGAILTIIAVIATTLPADTMRPGVVVAALVLARYLGAPVRRLTRVHELWLRARVARAKISSFFELERHSQPNRPKRLKRGDGNLKLDGVQATPQSEPVSARIAAGSRVLLQGSNGSGKSAMLRLLAGLDRPSSGRIVLDGRDLSRSTLQSLRKAIGYVDSRLRLLRGSLRRNLTYRSPDASQDDIDAVLALVDPAGRIAALPEGFETRLTENGDNLPSGVAQRLVLARALVAKPRVLLLDEPQLHLDQEGLAALRTLIATYPGTVIFSWNGADAPAADITLDLDLGRVRFERPTLVSTSRANLRPAAAETTELSAGAKAAIPLGALTESKDHA